MAEDTQDGAAGQRREGARGKSVKKQNEQKRARDRGQIPEAPPPPPLRTVTVWRKSGACKLQKSPPSPPCAFASPWHNRSFSPSCPRQHNRTSILPTYLFRLSYELTSHMLHRILLSSDWTTHSSSSNIMCLIVSAPPAAQILKAQP
jgi:hypothetical protein